MTLKSDNQGFLVGELVESNRDLIAGQKTGNRVLSSIRTDVSAIARAMGLASRASRSGGVRETVEPMSRGSRSSTRSAGNTNTPSGRASVREFGVRNPNATVSPVGRDSRGRFVAGQAVTKGDAGRDVKGRFTGSGDGGSSEGGGSRPLGKIGVLTDALKGITGNSEQIDPTLAAMKEVKDVVEPLGRGAMALFGRSDKQKKERWYNRIWKSLTNIEKKPTGGVSAGADGEGGGILGSLSMSLKGILPMIGSVFTKILGPIALLWGSFELGQWVGKKIYEWLDQSGLMNKVFEAFDSISKGISGAWATATDGFIKALDFFKSIPDRVGAVLTAIDQGVRKIPVIGDIYGKAADATKATATQAKAGYDTGRGTPTDAPAPSGPVQVAARSVGGTVGKAVTATSNASMMLKSAYDAGITSPKELANFMGQNAHESGNFTQLQENLNYKPEQLLKTFKGRNGMNTLDDAKRIVGGGQGAIAEAVYGGAWGAKSLGNTEAGDGEKFKGRGFTQLTGKSNYAAASKALGIDLVNNPDQAADPETAAKISAWFWKKNVSARGAGMDPVLARKAMNGGFNGLADANTKVAEWDTKIAGGAMPGVTAATSVTSGGLPAYVPAPVPTLPAKLPAMPEISIPAPSTEKDRPTVVSIRQPIGQDVSDRSIAHVVTGGLGAS